MKADALHLALLHVQVLVLGRAFAICPTTERMRSAYGLAARHALLRLAHLARPPPSASHS
jgi:hypothetical protein